MQGNLPLISSMHGRPQAAPAKVLRQITCEAQAVAVSIKMSGFKLAYIAACFGKSESYICRIKRGKRPVPEWFVTPFCRMTGTTLLQQFIDLQDDDEDRLNARLANELRKSA